MPTSVLKPIPENPLTHSKSGPFISFKFKLMAAVALTVAAVTAASLFKTQQSAEKTYTTFLTEQFERQIALSLAKQEIRLASARTAVADATTNVRLIAALDAGDIDRFYSDVWFELDNVIERYQPLDFRMPKPFFRYIDWNGTLQPPPGTKGFGKLPGDPDAAKTTLEGLASAGFDELLPSRFGYVSFEADSSDLAESENGLRKPYEILITPIFDPVTGYFMGDIVFGKVSEPEETRIGGENALLSGIVLDENVAMAPWDPEVNRNIMQLLEESFATNATPTIRFGADTYMVFADYVPRVNRFPGYQRVILYPVNALEELKAESRASLLIAGLLATIVGILLSLLISEGIGRPIDHMVAATDRVQHGDFDISLKPRGNDEIARLMRHFNDMAAGLALKERYRSVLDMTNDPEVANRLLNGDIALGGEERVVSILFCDIRNFTGITEEMPPDEVIAMTNAHMTAMTGTVRDHKGVVDKFVGDEIMALFGAPSSPGDDAGNAVRCAMAMVATRERLNAEGLYRLGIGIGIATGRVVAGNVGSEDRLNYTVLGARVNLAARLCSAAEAGAVLVCPETQQAVRDAFSTHPREGLALKGFANATTAFEVLTESAAPVA